MANKSSSSDEIDRKKVAVASSLINPKRLDFWLKQKYNVLLEGKHGVGKTSIVIDAFERNKLRYICLSGATMDPFIDFVGVPVKVKTASGEQVIDLLRPKYIQDAKPQAIFIDEFNRSHKKVRNAVMELIQFKTINGQPISKDLRVVWAAINPDGDEGTYDTDRLDPAQRDRFHIQTTIPFQCDREYFTSKYGSKVANAAIEYWNTIPPELREQISPRRLDYALTVLKDGGDARDVLPIEANVSALTLAIKSGPISNQLQTFSSKTSEDVVKKFFSNEINFSRSLSTVLATRKYLWMLSLFPKEKLAATVMKSAVARRFICTSLKRHKKFSPFFDTMQEFATANQNHRWGRRIVKYLPKVKTLAQNLKPIKVSSSHFRNVSGPIAQTILASLLKGPSTIQHLVALASAAKKQPVPIAKIKAKLKVVEQWAIRNKKTFIVLNNNSWVIK